MLSKNEIKDIQSLGLKKNRDDKGLFVAEGPKVVGELLGIINNDLVKIYATESWLSLQENLDHNSVQIVTEGELKRLSQLETPNEVLAVFKKQQQQPPVLSAQDFCLYLDTVQDPGNVGTIVRIGDWFGVKYIVCSAGCADVYSPKVVQSTMASIGRVQLYDDKDGQWLHSQKTPILAATLQGKSLPEFPKKASGILLIGNESKGIRQEFLSLATEQITIPRKGGAESLNAAVATGIIVAHLLT